MSSKILVDFDDVTLRLDLKAETMRKVCDKLTDLIVAKVGDEIVESVIAGLDKKQIRNRVLYDLNEKAMDALREKWSDDEEA